jgi:hypothetical protein
MEIEASVFQELGRHEAQELVDLDFKYKRLRNFFELCESPIEQRFLFYVLDYNPHRFAQCTTGFDATHKCPAIKCTHWDLEEFPEFGVKIIAQHSVDEGQYRTDFLFELTRDIYATDAAGDVPVKLARSEVFARLVVELDGHDFHERTKEQAKRDKSRDRRLTALGFTVFRFTGSEVHAEPYRVADEVESYLANVMRKAEAGQVLPVDSERGGLMTNLKLVTRFFQRPYGRKSLLGY